MNIEHGGGVLFLTTRPSRTIILVDLIDDYRVRPEPSTFLAALDAAR